MKNEQTLIYKLKSKTSEFNFSTFFFKSLLSWFLHGNSHKFSNSEIKKIDNKFLFVPKNRIFYFYGLRYSMKKSIAKQLLRHICATFSGVELRRRGLFIPDSVVREVMKNDA